MTDKQDKADAKAELAAEKQATEAAFRASEKAGAKETAAAKRKSDATAADAEATPSELSPIERLREFASLAARSAAKALGDAREVADEAHRASGDRVPALHAKALHLGRVAASLGDAEGGINRALQALEAAAIHAARAKETDE